jgi:ribonuclease PH
MLPRSSKQRIVRDGVKGRIGGRSYEIQRLIGRSLRAVTDLKALGERTFIIDCDVIQADGGTRTAAVTGGFVALALAMKKAIDMNQMSRILLKDFMAAVSVGVVEGRPALDLCYLEDAQAEVDMNVVMTSQGRFIEVQGTAEADPFEESTLHAMLDLARTGIGELIARQKEVLGIESLER